MNITSSSFTSGLASRRPATTGACATEPANATAAAPCEAAGGDIGDARATLPGPLPAVFARDQLDALTRQQQRIVHRSALIDYVLAAERQGGQPLTMGDALDELLADITEAARTIGMILQQAGDRLKA